MLESMNEKYGKPLIILYERDPWLMVIGSDTPIFVLYESGYVIYKDVETNEHFFVKLSGEEKESLIKDLALSDLYDLDDDYDVSNWTDQPTNELFVNLDSIKTVTVYGAIRDGEEDRENTPDSFLHTFDRIVSYKNEKAEKWLPNDIEVMVWDYANAPDKPIEWPEEWPDLESETTLDRGGLHSIYLDNKYHDDLLSLMENLGEQQPVMINGKKFTIAYRLPFPNI